MIPCRPAAGAVGAANEMEQKPRTATRTNERFIIIKMKVLERIWYRVSHAAIELSKFQDSQKKGGG